MTKRKRRRFTPEFKREAVKLIRTSDRPIAELCQEMDLTETAVRRWLKQAEVDAGGGSASALTTDESEELRRLRKEIRELRMEKEILRKATAFFARESR